MPEEELDLVRFAAGKMTQTRAGAPEIMRCKLVWVLSFSFEISSLATASFDRRSRLPINAKAVSAQSVSANGNDGDELQCLGIFREEDVTSHLEGVHGGGDDLAIGFVS